MLADYLATYQRTQERLLCKIHAAPRKLIVFCGIKTVGDFNDENHVVEKKGCG